MRRKKVIIAFVLFFSITCGLFVFLNRNCYPFDEVATEICKDTKYVDQHSQEDMFSREERLKMHIASKAASPSVLENVISWYESNFRKKHYHYYHAGIAMKTIDPSKPVLLFYENGAVVVKLTYKMSLVNSIEIRSFSDTSQQIALKLKSRLSARFPNLPCKITDDEKPDVS